jgi:hypothetical protein
MALAIAVYTSNQKQLNKYLSISKTYQDGMQVVSALKTDIEKADYIFEDDNLIEVQDAGSITTYIFEETHLIRENKFSVQDTFDIQITDYQYTFVSSEINLVENIFLQFKMDDFEKEIRFRKIYPNATLFEMSHVD